MEFSVALQCEFSGYEQAGLIVNVSRFFGHWTWLDAVHAALQSFHPLEYGTSPEKMPFDYSISDTRIQHSAKDLT
jgi:hypothetical protein